MPQISVIMPVYNSKKYLKSAIESVLRQTFTDFELILIDDGSTDGSQDICDNYADLDKRVIVFHKKNGGICSARNKGLKSAKGKYLAFIDNDDEYLPELLMDNYIKAEKYKADVVRFGRIHKIVNDKGKIIIENNNKIVNDVYIGNEIDCNYSFILNYGGAGVWTGLYNLNFLKMHSIIFDENIKCGYEDHSFNINVYCFARTIVLNMKNYYVWWQRTIHSTSCKFDVESSINRSYSLINISKFEEKNIINCRNKISINSSNRRKLYYINFLMNDILKSTSLNKNLKNEIWNDLKNSSDLFNKSPKIFYQKLFHEHDWKSLFKLYMFDWEAYEALNLLGRIKICINKIFYKGV